MQTPDWLRLLSNKGGASSKETAAPRKARKPTARRREDTDSQHSRSDRSYASRKPPYPDHAADAAGASKRRGHDYKHVTAQGHARTHLGDTYIYQQTVRSQEEHFETQEEKRRRIFMDSLGFESMDSRLASIGAAHAETCGWLYETDEYIRWQDPKLRKTHGGFLWIKGKPGSGKSTLMKHALSRKLRHKDHIRVLYFLFNARGHELEQTTQGMYRSLLHQLFLQCPNRLPEPLSKDVSHWEKNGWPLLILQDMLRNALFEFENRRKLIFYIDALDECSEQAIRPAIEYIWSLVELATFRGVDLCVCFASRHYPNITIQRSEEINLDTKIEHEQDISAFVHKTLRGTSSMRKELGQEICRRCCGVFLWATLVVHSLNEKIDHGATRSQLMAVLEGVPTGIADLVTTVVQGHDSTLLVLLQWVLFSQCPLSVPQLYFAIMSSIGSWPIIDWTHNVIDLQQMCGFILTSSRGLVEFVRSTSPDPRSWRVQFIHETVREYFLAGGLGDLDNTLYDNMEAKCHSRLARCCQLYIERAGRDIQEIRSQDWVSLEELPLAFSHYVYHNTFWHAQNAFLGDTLQLSFLDAMPWTTWTDYESQEVEILHPPSIPLKVLQDYRCVHLVRALLSRRLTGISTGNMTADADELQLDLEANTARNGWTPLIHAVHAGHVETISLLLRCGADPNRPSLSGNAPLFYAIREHSLYSFYRTVGYDCVVEIIKLLIHHGADPNTRCSEGGLLEAAIGFNHNSAESNDIMKLLLERGARANGRASELGGPLSAVAAYGNEEMVQFLLDDGADIDGHLANRPLHSAVKSYELFMVQFLLQQGAQVNVLDYWALTALHEVAILPSDFREEMHIPIAQALLNAGANVNAVDLEANTPLTFAYRSGKLGLAILFMEHGANFTPPRPRTTPICRVVTDSDIVVTEMSDCDSEDNTITFELESLSE